MTPVILVIHILLALAIIGLVLIQRSEGGGLGIGGGGGSGGGLGGFATAKGTANALTRATAICATLFFCTSLALGIIASRQSTTARDILNTATATDPAAVVTPVGDDGEVQDMPIGDVPEAPVDAPKEQTAPSAPIAE